MKKLRISVDGKQYEVEVEVLQDDENQILPSYYQQTAFAPPTLAAPPVAAAPVAAPTAKPKAKQKIAVDGNALTSPINGVVLEVLVKPGQAVKENDVVAVLEAMKMKTNVASPKDGEIASVDVNMGDRVETGQALVTFK